MAVQVAWDMAEEPAITDFMCSGMCCAGGRGGKYARQLCFAPDLVRVRLTQQARQLPTAPIYDDSRSSHGLDGTCTSIAKAIFNQDCAQRAVVGRHTSFHHHVLYGYRCIPS